MTAEMGWSGFSEAAPDLAEPGQRLLYQSSETAAAFLATVVPDLGPRVHPVFPVLALGDLWLFIVRMSPKYRDLTWNAWFALHTLPTKSGGEEFYVRARGARLDAARTVRHPSRGPEATC